MRHAVRDRSGELTELELLRHHAYSYVPNRHHAGVAFFMKQIDKILPIPDDLMIRQFPNAN